jgi:REP element-mobilizing transposase RayT
MPRQARLGPGGIVYHALSRASGWLRFFKEDEDYQAFERVLLETQRRSPIRILSWRLTPNHWHFVPWPERDGQLAEFMRWTAAGPWRRCGLQPGMIFAN